LRVAYYSPLPPETSGIADYSALLLPALARHVRIAVVRRGARRSPRGVDVALYHVGNDPEAHGWIVDALRRRPGVVVLHDLVLHHLVAGTTLGRGDGASYLDALEREAGVPGRLLGHGVIDGRVPPLWESRPQDFPLTGEILRRATGLIVHSRYVEERVRAAGYRGPLWRIPHPAWPVPSVAPAAKGADPLIGCFGHLNASKRVPELLEAFARLRTRRPAARLLLVGPLSPRFRLAERVAGLGLAGQDALAHAGYVDEPRLWSLMAACDVCVSLRHPTMGETSGAALRALSLGRALVVSDAGWFSELPDDVALKVPVDAYELETLEVALDLLARDVAARTTLARNGRSYAEREHALDAVAESYAAALELAAGGAAVDDRVLVEVAAAARDSGLAAGDLRPVARALGEIGVGA
jgi:glycosyltransferase involved in cell wall biosynthesis